MLTPNQIRRKSYFVTEAIRIIDEEGLESLSARAVSKAAGFNPASIYTYFAGMEHLTALACVHYTQGYLAEFSRAAGEAGTWLERYLLMEELYLKHAFRDPARFSKVFYPNSDEPWADSLFQEFYEMFPDQGLLREDNPLAGFFMVSTSRMSHERGIYLLSRAAEEGSLDRDAVEYVLTVDISNSYFILYDSKWDTEEERTAAYRRTLKFHIMSLYHYVAAPYRPMLDGKLRYYETLSL